VFFDEIDSILGKRGEGENDSSRRLKTEFLVQMDGFGTNDKSPMVICATNRPWELDDAILRRLQLKVYIPMPEKETIKVLVESQLLSSDIKFELNQKEFEKLAKDLGGYSACDVVNLIRETAMIPLRKVDKNLINTIKPEEIAPILYKDFTQARKTIKPSVNKDLISKLIKFNDEFGS